MQFFVVHKDPYKNAKLLPHYCLKKVNVREGWQILSDIGHYFEVTWKGQNKLYNYNHPAVMRWRKDGVSFDRFVDYYEKCLEEYFSRYKKTTVFHEKFREFLCCSYVSILRILPEESNDEELTIEYILSAKTKFLTKEEIESLYYLLTRGD